MFMFWCKRQSKPTIQTDSLSTGRWSRSQQNIQRIELWLSMSHLFSTSDFINPRWVIAGVFLVLKPLSCFSFYFAKDQGGKTLSVSEGQDWPWPRDLPRLLRWGWRWLLLSSWPRSCRPRQQTRRTLQWRKFCRALGGQYSSSFIKEIPVRRRCSLYHLAPPPQLWAPSSTASRWGLSHRSCRWSLTLVQSGTTAATACTKRKKRAILEASQDLMISPTEPVREDRWG